MGTGAIGSGRGRAVRLGSRLATHSDPMRLILLLGLLALASGCIHTRPAPLDTADGRADLNARTAGRAATLHVRGAPSQSVRNLHLGPDETTWVDRVSGLPQSAPTINVAAVSVRRQRWWQSALIGAGIGTALGALEAARGCRSLLCYSPAATVGMGGLSGAAIGTAFGAGQTDRFVPPPRQAMRLDSLARP